MIARGFKPVGWVAAVGAAALSCYMLSLRVAAERADLTSLQRRIVATQQQIRTLQTELGTRGRLQQLEQWNEEVLALAAPSSGQYLHSNVELARFSAPRTSPLDSPAEVRMASAPAASAPAPAPAAPAMPAPQRAVADARSVAPPPPLERPIVQRASLTVARPPAQASEAGPAPQPTAAAEVRPTAAAARLPRARVAAAATPDRHRPLLDSRIVRELGSAARAERGGDKHD
jgi:hypothetical protein